MAHPITKLSKENGLTSVVIFDEHDVVVEVCQRHDSGIPLANVDDFDDCNNYRQEHSNKSMPRQVRMMVRMSKKETVIMLRIVGESLLSTPPTTPNLP